MSENPTADKAIDALKEAVDEVADLREENATLKAALREFDEWSKRFADLQHDYMVLRRLKSLLVLKGEHDE